MAKKKPVKRKTTNKAPAVSSSVSKPADKPRPARADNEQTPTDGKYGFPIVGIGASAGGFDALRRLLEAAPDRPGVAFVVVQHLDPTRKSLAPELLSKYTKMQVAQVEDDPRVKPNCVYIIPPDRYLSISNGDLHLSQPDRPRGLRMAIDYFLRSLAADQQQCAIGVILSGTGSDGSLGIKAVKAAGGLVIAQEPKSAEFDGMPRSAIDTGLVDHALPPEEIPAVLVRYAQHPYVRERAPAAAGGDPRQLDKPPISDGFNSVLSLVRVHTKHDFSNYKDTTLIRRTRRRMCLYHVDDYGEYLEYLRAHPNEIDALAKDLLISVTDFFREPAAWQQLRQVAIEPLVQRKGNDDPIRVWTPGCATGEEPYSLAMLLLEALKQAEKDCPLQIFASDIDKDALAHARAGRYPRSIEVDVSAPRLSRFFTADGDDYYHVNKMLRETVIFAEQNLIADPPFSKLDMICCRNLLIYLKPDVQEKVIALFHFALGEGGVLMLGSAETAGRQTDLFQTLDKRWRIFRRIGPTHHDRVDIPLTTSGHRRQIEPPLPQAQRRETRLTHLAQQRLLDVLAPSAVLIDRNWRVLYISGDVDNYLTRPAGVPSDNLLDNVRRGLRTKLRGAVHTALSGDKTVSVQARVQTPAGYAPVGITVRVLKDREQQEDLALVVFDESGTSLQLAEQEQEETSKKTSKKQRQGESLPHTDIDDDDAVVRQLEEELADVKDDLQASIEHLESSNEEFKASNEEVMSVNEELQSTNEELETSKEELQSLNEEVSTVNNQLASKVDELETKHADLENLLAVTDVPTLCLDTDLNVRWFTPAVQQVVRLQPSDRGRPLADFAHDFADGDLVKIAQRVLKKLVPVEDEVTCHDGRTFLRRIHPYRADNHRIGGVVITLVDITSRKRFEQTLLADEARLRTLLDSSLLVAWIKDEDGRYQFVSSNFQQRFDKRSADYQGKTDEEIWSPEIAEQLRHNDLRVLNSGQPVEVVERVPNRDGTISWWLVNKFIIRDGSRQRCVGGVAIDITERELAGSELRNLNETLEQQVAQRTDMLKLLQDITRVANQAGTVDEAMLAAMERISHFNGWHVGHVWILAEQGRESQRASEAGAAVSHVVSSGIWFTTGAANQAVQRLEEFQLISQRQHISPGEGLIGRVMQSGQPQWIDDLEQFDDWRRNGAEHLGLHAAIAFPVTVNGEIVAVMEFFSAHPANRDNRFLEVMPDVGIQLGHVIQRKRLEKMVADATEREQRRIGGDIHDGVGQELTGLRYMAQTHAESLAEQSLPDAETAQRMTQWLGTVQAQLRGIVRQLVPVEVDAKGLVAALRGLAEETTAAHALVCRLECPQPISIADATLATHLYRIAQEAVSNAAQHAEASEILIQLIEDDGTLKLQVIDNGVGISPSSAAAAGFGLRSMAYRAGLIGARFDCQPVAAGGTQVTCTVLRAAG